MAQNGQFIGDKFVCASRHRNKREEHAWIKHGEIPDNFMPSLPKIRQKGLGTRWTKKSDEMHCGYNNHVTVNNQQKSSVTMLSPQPKCATGKSARDYSPPTPQKMFGPMTPIAANKNDAKLYWLDCCSYLNENVYRNYSLAESKYEYTENGAFDWHVSRSSRDCLDESGLFFVILNDLEVRVVPCMNSI